MLMKKILNTPTDFSDIAANAYQFAQNWRAKRMSSKGHACVSPLFRLLQPLSGYLPVAEFGAVKRELMKNFIKGTPLSPGKQAGCAHGATKTELCIGFAGEGDPGFQKVDLIVMGTTVGQPPGKERSGACLPTSPAIHCRCCLSPEIASAKGLRDRFCQQLQCSR